LSYLRRDGDGFVVMVFNFTTIPRHGYRVGVPVEGNYRELLNSDSGYYAGTDVGNSGQITTEPVSYNGRPHSLSLTLPPLAGVVLKIQPD
jgi:1,4-alpha-glucan branching enzyme